MTAPTCPRCGGPLWCSPTLGLLGRHGSACPLGISEDARQVVDHDAGRGDFGRARRRLSTQAERTLLVAAGADEQSLRWSNTDVVMLTRGLRRRTFVTRDGQPIVVSSLPDMPVTDTPPGVVQ